MSNPHLIIDWSVISYKQWFRMSSANYDKQTTDEEVLGSSEVADVPKLEQAEFNRNMYLYVQYLVSRFKPSKLIIALDDTPWRNKVYQDYYVKNSTVMKNDEIEQYLIRWDFIHYLLTYHEGIDKWVKKRVTIKELTEMEDSGFVEFIEISDLEEKRQVLYTTLYNHSPRYKKRDKSGWASATKYEEYKRISKGLAYNIANSFNGLAIEAKDAEADDIISVYIKALANKKQAVPAIVVSIDQDIYQLALDYMFFHYYNPNMLAGTSDPYGGFVPLTEKMVRHELKLKVLAGDKSDTIPGCFVTGKKVLLSGDKAEEIILKSDAKEIVSTKVNNDVLQRNMTLIYMDRLPKEIKSRIVDRFKNPIRAKATYSPEHYFVNPLDIKIIKDVAETHALSDNFGVHV